MYQALLIIHVLVAFSIIALVLLQHGRGADAGAAFGSGASGTVFGARGAASFLTRTTGVLAVMFFASSLVLAILGDIREIPNDLMDTPVTSEPEGDLPVVLGESTKLDLTTDLPVTESSDIIDEPVQEIVDDSIPAIDSVEVE